MKSRFLIVLIVGFISAITLMWVVAVQGSASPAVTSHPADVILMLDASESMAYEPPSGYAYTGNSSKGCHPYDVGIDQVNACVKACNDDPNHPCYPLQYVKNAAKSFVSQLRPGLDRVAIVSYARASTSIYPLGADVSTAKTMIDGVRAFDNGGVPCPYFGLEPWRCSSSNPGGAIRRAAYELTGEISKVRNDTLWVAVLLSSGGMNATDPMVTSDPDSAIWGVCPAKTPGDPATKNDPPLCRDQRWSVHHPTPMAATATPTPTPAPSVTPAPPTMAPSYWYDAEDYAYDNATYLGKAPLIPQDRNGLGVVIYSIAFGQKAVCATGTIYSPGPPVVCGSWNPFYEDLDSHLPNTGELFLRYAAAVGDDGDPNTDPCHDVPSGIQCGNYYFAPHGDDLPPIFLEIAGRIFTPTLPAATFDAMPQSGIAPMTVYFTSTSTGNVVNYLWDFGDTVTGTASMPTHTYAASGLFTVALRVDDLTSFDILTRTNYITVSAPRWKIYLPIIQKSS